MLALSSAVSLLSSHRFTRGKRKPEGGGPAGVAARGADEENDAVAARAHVVRAETSLPKLVDAGRARNNIVKGVIEAMVFMKRNVARGTIKVDVHEDNAVDDWLA